MKKAKNYISSLVSHKTFKNVGYLTIGGFIGRVLSLVGVFYIPKLLGPEQYGIYNTVTSFVTLFTVFTFEGINKVVIRESAKNLTKSREIIESTFGLRIIFSFMATILCIVVAAFIDYDYGVKLYVGVFSISLVLSATRRSLNAIHQSFENMKTLAIMTVIRPLLRVPIALAFLMNGFGVLALIIIDLVIDSIMTIIVYKTSRKLLSFNIFSSIRFIKDYIVPGFRFSLLGFLNTLSCRIDIFMLSILTTQHNVGIYALAYRIVEAGLILRQPISQSIFPHYSNKFGKSNPRFMELVKHMTIIAIPMLLILIPSSYIFKPAIIAVFGIEYEISAEIFSVLVFYLIFYFALIPWGLFFETTGNEQYSIYICAACAILNILLNIILFEKYGIIGMAYSTLAVELFRLTCSVLLTSSLIVKINKQPD